MHIAALRIENVGPFRGKFDLQLEAIPYAITAEREGDSESSNWCGKSSLLEAVLLALYGVHRHRFEDGWISNGEKTGEAQVYFSDGSAVRRWRERGSATQLQVSMRESVLKGDEAQKRIEELVGLGLEDFRTTSYFRQKETGGMVSASPSERTATVARWLRLEPLERAAASCRADEATAVLKLTQVRSRIEAAKERRGRAGGALVDRSELEGLRTAIAEADADLARARDAEGEEYRLEERDCVLEEGRRLAAEHKAEDGKALDAEMTRSSAARDAAALLSVQVEERHKNRVLVATGTFGGTCPVAGIACPATEEINSLGAVSARETSAAERERRDARTVWDEARRALNHVESKLSARRAREVRLQGLRKRLKELPGGERPPPDPGRAQRALQARNGASLRLVEAEHRQREYDQATEELGRLEAEEQVLGLEVAVCRESARILGRSGAQRRLAEGVIGEVARGANDMLAIAGVDLSLECTWEREGKGVADECGACGAAYPASTKVKKCAGCGAPRGPKVVQQFDVELSARSGAAEDLAGLSLSLAAGRFLREERGSSWSSVFLDEVGAHLDRTHRRALNGHLLALLAATGVKQAFVISHSPDSVASLPGGISIQRGADGWSKVSVLR
jgi:DNA repair exonuclease SbcCD ATPase subunit